MAKQRVNILSNRDARRIQELLHWFDRVGKKLGINYRRRSGVPSTGGSSVRVAVIKENPSNKDNVKINLLDSSAVEQTEGDESGLDCYGLIANGTRLDMALPRINNGMKIFIRQIDIGDGLRWYFDTTFQGTKDYTI